MKRLIAAVLAFAFVGALAGCNTMGGFGKDVEKTGEGIQKESKK